MINKSIKWSEDEAPADDIEEEKKDDEEGKNEENNDIDGGKGKEIDANEDMYRVYFLALLNHNFELCHILKP